MVEPARPVGYVAVTDHGWYEFLAARPDLDEVNFWRPKDQRQFHILATGAPLFFKLRSPHFAIGGFAYFVRFAVLPLSLVWETFEQKNGAASFAEMRDRIIRLRHEPLAPGSDPEIGCIVLTEPTFLAQSDWVRLPDNFHPTLTQGKPYDLTAGEGRRIWEECLARVRPRLADRVSDADRYGAPHLHRPRLGQGGFKVSILEAYERRCAVTGEHSLPVLDAAHIRPYAEQGPHEVSNGLLLRSDVHRLYDAGFATITPDLRFHVSPALRERWENGRTYYALEGREVTVPRDRAERPNLDLLAWHASEKFVR